MAIERKKKTSRREIQRRKERKLDRSRNRRAKTGSQLPLGLRVRKHGGKRGKPRPTTRVPHRRRALHFPSEPAHITWRMEPRVWNLRSARSFAVLRSAFRESRDRFGCRLVSYSVQGNHLHLIREAPGERELAKALNALATRIARGLNRMMGTKGRVFAERYHQHVLRTVTEVRNALRYLATNALRHARQAGLVAREQDPFTCLGLLDFRSHRVWATWATGPPEVVEPQTRLLWFWQLT